MNINNYQLPPPEAFSLPQKFTQWRPGQEQAISQIIHPKSRFIINVKPTGGGKSLDYITAAIILDKRTAILTSTKGLQQQLYKDFGQQPGAIIVMGKNEYNCRLFPISCEYGPCRFGMKCSYKYGGCPYYDNLVMARRADIIITNYSFWFNHPNLFEAIGEIDFLICDEAHDTISNMMDAMSLSISDWTCKNILNTEFPKVGLNDSEYWNWAKDLSEAIRIYVDEIKENKEQLSNYINDKRFQSVCDFEQRIAQQIVNANTAQWVVEHTGKTITFDPMSIAEFAENVLFKDIKHILLTSATITKDTLLYLGIDENDINYNEFDSHFPAKNHPVIFIPTIRVFGDHRMTDRDYRILLNRIDNIIKPRLDRNGIIHPVSYARANKIYQESEYKEYILMHEQNARDRGRIILQFKAWADNPPRILLSPSVTTGYDFPGKECEYQIIVKIPFPDARRKVDKIRREINPDYYNNLTMTTLEQSVGRGWRSEDDRCETFIIDNNWKWFRKNNDKFMHKWFRRLLKESNVIPKPAEKL